MRDNGLLVFTYHHSRNDGWQALAEAVLDAGFTVINSQPVKSEMAVATPKSAAKEPIAFDIILVCRKQPRHTNPKRQRDSNPTRERGAAQTNPKRERGSADPKRERGECASTTTYQEAAPPPVAVPNALSSARSKIDRLLASGFALSRNDRKIILYGQLLTTLFAAHDAASFATIVDDELSRADRSAPFRRPRPQQQVLFEPT